LRLGIRIANFNAMNDTGSLSRNIVVGELSEQSRATFVSRTYGHLFGAVMAFTLLEVYFFRSGLAETIANALIGVNWLFVLGGFMVVSWLASRTAHLAQAKAAQYAALAAYVVAEAIIFVPLLYIADKFAPGAVSSAAAVTFIAFTALTAVVFFTRKDFSFLRGMLFWGAIIALTLIVAGAIFGFQLGVFFSIAMVALAGGAILYDTSNVLHHYRTEQYVAASLALFASVGLLFWYILQIVISLSDRR